MATERKPVCFNVNDPVEREMFELAKSMNFSGWVKENLKPLALDRIAIRVKKGVGTPVPVRKVANVIDGTKA
ncbi:hypothetical protein [Brevibacillus porteri]|uniref:hypothetical protein n=1 Tax=Brevibacillus porteri TaxID=2126350 RepID=UPI003D229883